MKSSDATGRCVDTEGTAGEGSGGSEGAIIGNRGKGALPPQGKKLSKLRNLDIRLSTFPSDMLDV